MLPGKSYAQKSEFTSAFEAKVKKYLQDSGGPQSQTGPLFVDFAVALVVFLGPYLVLLSGLITTWWAAVLLGLIMSDGFVRLGSAQHHANHQSLYRKKWVNSLFGRSLLLLGLSRDNWLAEHNRSHHMNTNIAFADVDLHSGGKLLVFTPYARIKANLQQRKVLYVFALYTLTFISWILVADWRRVRWYYGAEGGKLMNKEKSLRRHLIELTAFKVTYFFAIFVLPVFLGVAWYLPIIMFLVCWVAAGIQFMTVFQIAHINMHTEHFDGHIPAAKKIDWFLHALRTTGDWWEWGTGSKFFDRVLTRRYGYLNFQAIHHMFFQVSPVHYPAISRILVKHIDEWKDTLPEGVEYIRFSSFLQGARSHFQYIRKLPEIIPSEFQAMG